MITDLIGTIFVVIGIVFYLWCVHHFTFFGKGTPAFYEPPKKLVVQGLYGYVRNPMYVGILFLLIGETLLYGSPILVFYTIALAVILTLSILWYEEPRLRKQFGQEYEEYSKRVNRWLPKSTMNKARKTK
jgi:protein-S-isoprenylcysteine O-methyltransferase Ste14